MTHEPSFSPAQSSSSNHPAASNTLHEAGSSAEAKASLLRELRNLNAGTARLEREQGERQRRETEIGEIGGMGEIGEIEHPDYLQLLERHYGSLSVSGAQHFLRHCARQSLEAATGLRRVTDASPVMGTSLD